MILTMRLKNIKFSEYLYEISEKIRDEYDFAIKLGDVVKPTDHFKIGDFTKCKFGFVKDFQTLYSNADIEPEKFYSEYFRILNEWHNISRAQILNESVFFFYDVISYIAAEVKKINTIEENLISNVGNIDEESNETFSRFGVFPQLLTLANDDITKIKDVEQMQYNVCFTTLLYNKEKYEYQYKMQQKANKSN